MADYTSPTQSAFEAAETEALDIMTSRYPSILTKAGSVVRELLVRPVAYIYAWLSSNLSSMLEKTSMTYLSTSQLTENETADMIASNYFVERRSGTRSSGAVTMIISTSVLDLASGSTFDAEGVSLMTESHIIAVDQTARTEGSVRYVPIYPYNTTEGTYSVTIPVVAVDTGSIELPSDTEVTANFSGANIVSLALSSAVTGGSDTETDASLMARAKTATAESGIGSFYGIGKKLASYGAGVIGYSIVAGEDTPLYRARYNTTNINPGGMVDCYVKTQNQPSCGEITATSISGTSAVFQDSTCAGPYTVLHVYADDVQLSDFTVAFSSSEQGGTAEGSRLSPSQVTTVTAAGISGATTVRADVSYMPGLVPLQTFVDGDENRFVGQDLRVKAAVPAELRIDCVLKYQGEVTDDILDAVKQAMADYVNGLPVGTRLLNFSDIADAVAASVQGAAIRIPCAVSVDITLPDGSMESTYSTSGIMNLDSPAGSDYWDSQVCFFSLVKRNIRLDIA